MFGLNFLADFFDNPGKRNEKVTVNLGPEQRRSGLILVAKVDKKIYRNATGKQIR